MPDYYFRCPVSLVLLIHSFLIFQPITLFFFEVESARKEQAKVLEESKEEKCSREHLKAVWK
jgi:hypothetical protein